MIMLLSLLPVDAAISSLYFIDFFDFAIFAASLHLIFSLMTRRLMPFRCRLAHYFSAFAMPPRARRTACLLLMLPRLLRALYRDTSDDVTLHAAAFDAARRFDA